MKTTAVHYDFFINYTRCDSEVARNVYDKLTGLGFTCFYDACCIDFGEIYADVVQNAIVRSNVFLSILSAHSGKSEWFLKELDYAISIGKRIAPIVVDDSQYHELDPEILLRLGTLQFRYLSEPDIWDRLISIAVSCRRSLLDDEASLPRDLDEVEREIRRLDNYVPTKTSCDIFISYRRHLGRDIARSVQLKLQLLGYTNVFFDYESIRDGVFNTQIIDAIYSCKDFLLLLSPESMERCSNRGDWVAREIRTALKYDRKIIPLVLESDFKWPQSFPSDLAPVKSIQFHKLLYDEYFDDSIRKLSQRFNTKLQTASVYLEGGTGVGAGAGAGAGAVAGGGVGVGVGVGAGVGAGAGAAGVAGAAGASAQLFNYKVFSDAKCLIYVDDNEPVVVEAGALVKIPLRRGEYFIKAVACESNSLLFHKIVTIDYDKAEMISQS